MIHTGSCIRSVDDIQKGSILNFAKESPIEEQQGYIVSSGA
jgi:hypothetical protein